MYYQVGFKHQLGGAKKTELALVFSGWGPCEEAVARVVTYPKLQYIGSLKNGRSRCKQKIEQIEVEECSKLLHLSFWKLYQAFHFKLKDFNHCFYLLHMLLQDVQRLFRQQKEGRKNPQLTIIQVVERLRRLPSTPLPSKMSENETVCI
jgi:hypothetical protein